MRRNPGDRDGKSTTSTLQKANCSIPVFLALFDPVKACVHSMWRMCASVLVCECVCVPERKRLRVQCVGMRGRTGPGAE